MGKSILPILGDVVGGLIGTAIEPGIGTAIGAGLGGEVGGVASGESVGQALPGALIGGATAGIGSEVAPLIGEAAGNIFGSAAPTVADASSNGFLSGVSASDFAPVTAVDAGGVAAGGIADASSGFLSGVSASDFSGAAAPTAGGAAAGTPSAVLPGISTATGGLTGTPVAGGAAAGPTLPGISAAAGSSDLTAPLTDPSVLGGAGNANSLTPDITAAAPGGSSISNFQATTGINPSTLGGPQGAGGAGTAVVPGGAAPGGAGGTVADAASSSPITDMVLKALGKNPIGSAISGAGLVTSLLKGNSIPDESQLKAEAGSLSGQGTTLQQYLNSGTLPPGAQQAITNATQSAKAAIRSQYAQLGESGSTAERNALANVDQQAAAQAFDIADSLYSQGVQDTQISSQIYQMLMQANQAQNSSLGSAIANFASSFGGSPTIKIGNAA